MSANKTQVNTKIHEVEVISRTLLKLEKLAEKDPSLKNNIWIDDIVNVSKFMVTQHSTEYRDCYEKYLMQHMSFLLVLEPHQRDNFTQLFGSITDFFLVLCERDVTNYNFIDEMLDIWLSMTGRVDDVTKFNIFRKKQKQFEICAKFIHRVGCSSMQLKMLDIILAYANVYEDKRKCCVLAPFFENFVDDTNVFRKRITELHPMSDSENIMDVRKRDVITSLIGPNTTQTLSNIIQFAFFNKKQVILYPNISSWLDWNLGSNTIEFRFWYNNQKTLAKIDGHALQLIRMRRSNDGLTKNLLLTLRHPLRIEASNEIKVKDKFVVNEIEFNMTYGIITERLVQVLHRMFPNQYEFFDLPENDCVMSDVTVIPSELYNSPIDTITPNLVSEYSTDRTSEIFQEWDENRNVKTAIDENRSEISDEVKNVCHPLQNPLKVVEGVGDVQAKKVDSIPESVTGKPNRMKRFTKEYYAQRQTVRFVDFDRIIGHQKKNLPQTSKPHSPNGADEGENPSNNQRTSFSTFIESKVSISSRVRSRRKFFSRGRSECTVETKTSTTNSFEKSIDVYEFTDLDERMAESSTQEKEF